MYSFALKKKIWCISDDCMKDKQYLMEGNGDVIFCESLAKIVVEAMFTFWEFLRKDEKSNSLKIARQAVTDPIDSRLLVDIKKDFQKVCLIKLRLSHFYSSVFYRYCMFSKR